MIALAAWNSSSVMLESSCIPGAPFVSVDSTGVGLPDALLAAMVVDGQGLRWARWQQCDVLGAVLPVMRMSVARPLRQGSLEVR